MTQDGRMRAVQVVEPIGPDGVRVVEVPEPEPRPGDVVVEVHAVGVSFPDLLLSRGQYQVKPEPPFTLGADLAGTIVSAPKGLPGLVPGARVAGILTYGGAGERAVLPASAVLPLPDRTSYDEGAALPMNYLTALFALRERGQVREGETVLVHGAAGGVGTATLQVARGLGIRTIGVVSTAEKAAFARAAGADETVPADGFKDAVTRLTGGRGVDAVVDVVGGDSFTDSLRCLGEQGRLLVVGFASGQGIPEVRVNRLLLNNVDVRGVGLGAFAMTKPAFLREQWDLLRPMLESGSVRPAIGATYDLDGFPRALQDLADRRTLGKSVVRIR
jgi:NADPH2:quinone reductase